MESDSCKEDSAMTTGGSLSTTRDRLYAALLLASGQPVRASSGQEPRLYLPALLSAVLLWLCYFPVAWGWLGWVALVPLLSLVRVQASSRRIYLAAWLAGSAFFWPALQWLREADYRMYATWAGLAIYCSLYFP